MLGLAILLVMVAMAIFFTGACVALVVDDMAHSGQLQALVGVLRGTHEVRFVRRRRLSPSPHERRLELQRQAQRHAQWSEQQRRRRVLALRRQAVSTERDPNLAVFPAGRPDDTRVGRVRSVYDAGPMTVRGRR